ncbi:hypothetical protein Asp14428_01690 [Actinoplanes sp. NBRC 14428]|nr:hypothetical protein Asp14428_01690 [Actinoplanes sp. NBRC 14428]
MQGTHDPQAGRTTPPDWPAPDAPLPGEEPTVELPAVTEAMLAEHPWTGPTLARAALSLALTPREGPEAVPGPDAPGPDGDPQHAGPADSPTSGAAESPHPGAMESPHPGAMESPHPGAVESPHPGAVESPHPGAMESPHSGPMGGHDGGSAGFEPAGFEPAGLQAAGLQAADLQPAGLQAESFEAGDVQAAGVQAAGFERAEFEAAGFEGAVGTVRGLLGRRSAGWTLSGLGACRTPGGLRWWGQGSGSGGAPAGRVGQRDDRVWPPRCPGRRTGLGRGLLVWAYRKRSSGRHPAGGG